MSTQPNHTPPTPNLIKCGRNVTTAPHYHLSTADVRSCYTNHPAQCFTETGEFLGTINNRNTATTETNNSRHRRTLDDWATLRLPTAATREAQAHKAHKAQSPTEPQLKYYTDLAKLKGITPVPNPQTFFNRTPGHPRNISTEIDRLKALPTATHPLPADPTNRPATTANGTPSPTFHAPFTPVEDGVYFTANPNDPSDPNGPNNPSRYFKVVTSPESGRRYAKVFNPTTKKFKHAPGAIRTLKPEHKVTPEQAKTFGRLYGICCFCGRTLTDERSIGAGYGPVCATRYGLPWGDHTATPVDTSKLTS